MSTQTQVQILIWIVSVLTLTLLIIKSRLFPKSWQWDLDFPLSLISSHFIIFYAIVLLDAAGIIDAHVVDSRLFSFWSTAIRAHVGLSILGIVVWRIVILFKLQRIQRENHVD
jgi:cytochrome b561